MIPPPNLPSGWEAVASKDTGQVYFINSVTGEYQFEVPQVSAEQEALTIDESLQGADRTAARLKVLLYKLQMVYEQMIGADDSDYGAPALCLAAAEGSVEAIAAVCAADPNAITAQHPISGAGALHMVCCCCPGRCVAELGDRMSDLTHRDCVSDSAQAAFQGHVDCVEELLAFGADPFMVRAFKITIGHSLHHDLCDFVKSVRLYVARLRTWLCGYGCNRL